MVIAEDILDSGLTLTYLLKNLASRNPASLTHPRLFVQEDEGKGRKKAATSIVRTSASSAPTSSSWATASITRSDTATYPTSACLNRKFTNSIEAAPQKAPFRDKRNRKGSLSMTQQKKPSSPQQPNPRDSPSHYYSLLVVRFFFVGQQFMVMSNASFDAHRLLSPRVHPGGRVSRIVRSYSGS